MSGHCSCVYAGRVLARRLLILLAVLLGLTALAAGLAPRRSAQDAGAPPAAQATLPPAAPVKRTLDAERSDQRVRARVGQPVAIAVQSDAIDSVSLEDYGAKPVEPGLPALFDLLADTPGRYAIELVDARRTIGTLEVLPAKG
jgi:hypothetical protein